MFKTSLYLLGLMIIAGSMATTAIAHELSSQHSTHNKTEWAAGAGMLVAQTVVPEAEKKVANALMASGPKKTSGIKGVKKLGAVALQGEFKDLDSRVLRVREIHIHPGGVVAVHRHDGRPGVAYIIEGTLTEHRTGEKSPLIKKTGDVAFEKTGVVHWWKNTGTVVARALVVDIVPEK